MVRLKEPLFDGDAGEMHEFQFQYGTIERFCCTLEVLGFPAFQFQYGTIESV